MTTCVSADPKELMAYHVISLTEYARRAILTGEVLTPDEEEDKAACLREFMAVGTSFKCTEKELVKLLLKGALGRKRDCGCFNCRASQGAGQLLPS